jgi:serine/threonine-protein kinase HipA
MTDHLRVTMYGQEVGEIWRGGDGRLQFQLSRSYWGLKNRPVVGQWFEDQRRERVYREQDAWRAPRFFANDLPEGVVRRLIERQHDLSPGDDFGLLTVLGRDLPGALEVTPGGDWRGDVGQQTQAEVVTDPWPLAEETKLRFSLAGVQLKLSMVNDGRRFSLPTRGTDGDWLVKFAGQDFAGSVENEYAVMTWAKAAGFVVPELKLCPLSDVVGVPEGFNVGDIVFAIRRYDRAKGSRIHQEDFAQLTNTPPQKKYDHITYEQMGVLALALLGEKGLVEYLRRLVFMVASGNADAHLKNWSLYYPQRRSAARWSPLYDQVCTVAWPNLSRESALKLAGVKPFHQVSARTFGEFRRRVGKGAQASGVELPEVIADEAAFLAWLNQALAEIARAWPVAQAQAPLPAAHVKGLQAHWERTPLLAESGFFRDLV